MTPQELKNSILQLAIQGKLVEQRPEEGTAEELYREIQKEKQALIKAGKIKKEKELPESDDPPFDIPESWFWARITDCGVFISGFTPKPDELCKFGVIPYFKVSDMNTFGNELWMTKTEQYLKDPNPKKVFLKNTIVYPKNGGAVFTNKKRILAQNSIVDLNTGGYTVIGPVDLQYMYMFFSRIDFRQCYKGTALPTIDMDKLKKLWIPLPPLAEQKRIVARIEELLPLIDRYEKAWTHLEDFNKRFPGDMQKSILQMAIQGKLTEQLPEDGTAEDLYRQIQEEKQTLIKAGKIKKDKPLPEIGENEIPFEIPANWKWVRLSNLARTIVDCPHSTPHYYEQRSDYVAIDTNCIDADGNITQWRYIDKDTYQVRISQLQPMYNDIVYTREGSICRAAIIPDNKAVCLGQRVMLIRCPDGVLPKYLKMFLMSPQTVKILTAMQRGIGALHVNVADVCNLLVPLPPKAEQERIIAKLDKLMPLCRRLK